MKKLITVAILISLIGVSGCSFVMKEYDARNEKKLAELDEQNKALTSKVRTLEHKVPQLNQHIKDLQTDNQKLRKDLSDIDTKISTIDTEKIESEELEGDTSLSSTPAPKPEVKETEKPFTLSETEEAPTEEDNGKPQVQAPKSKLTPEAQKIMEMMQQGEGSTSTTAETNEEEVPVPTPEATQPTTTESTPPAEEAGSKSELTPDAEKIMAMAKKKMGIEDTTTEETSAEPEAMTETAVTPEPEPTPEPTPKVETSTTPEEAAPKSELTPEAKKLIAMARGEEYVPEGKEAQKTQPSQTAAKQVAFKPVKLKVLGGTGSLSKAKKMAKKLEGMGYKAKTVSLAPRSNFERNTVYYSPGFKDTAEELKKELGGKTITKALSWKSEFDIIVVEAE